jgi:hypothetical protein
MAALVYGLITAASTGWRNGQVVARSPSPSLGWSRSS